MDEAKLTGFLWMAAEADKSSAVADELVALLRLACDGDLAAFEEVVRRTERQVFFTARRLLGNTEDAQDAAQEVFVRAYRFLNRLSDARQFRSWLYRVTVNVCNDLLAKRKNTSAVPIDQIELSVPLQRHDPESELVADERQRLVYEALETLPAKARAAVVLRDIQGLSTREVAEILGSTETTVRSQISLARLRLKKLLEKRIGRTL